MLFLFYPLEKLQKINTENQTEMYSSLHYYRETLF